MKDTCQLPSRRVRRLLEIVGDPDLADMLEDMEPEQRLSLCRELLPEGYVIGKIREGAAYPIWPKKLETE